MKATLSGRDTRTFMKLVVDGTTDRVVGCHIVGPDAGEMIQLIGIAVKMRATKADFDATMARASDRRRGARDDAREGRDPRPPGGGIAVSQTGLVARRQTADSAG